MEVIEYRAVRKRLYHMQTVGADGSLLSAQLVWMLAPRLPEPTPADDGRLGSATLSDPGAGGSMRAR